MIWASFMAAGGFAAGGLVLLAGRGPLGLALSAAAMGLGLGGVASLTAGLVGFACLAAVGVGAAALVAAGARTPWLSSASWLLGSSITMGRSRLFGERSLRLLIGLGGLVGARLLSGHLAAGTILTQGPAFACLFAWEVGVIRLGTSRGPADLGLGAMCAGMGSAAFLLLEAPTRAFGTASLVAAATAAFMVLVAGANPWEAIV